MAKVTVFYTKGQRRSMILAEAAYNGCKRIGEDVKIMEGNKYRGVDSDYAVFYGLSGGLPKVWNDYKVHAKAVYIDLGYYGRREGGRWDGYHKLSVNDRHPTEYFNKVQHGPERFLKLGLEIMPWREPGEEILVAGMSYKAAACEGIKGQEWERWAIAEIMKESNRKIRFRPKPNCPRSRPIKGTLWDNRRSVVMSFENVHALVTRHSNVACDALLHGIPVFSEYGIASTMGHREVSMIETPIYPDNREQFFYDLAYCQWTRAEIERGLPFKLLKSEGVLP